MSTAKTPCRSYVAPARFWESLSGLVLFPLLSVVLLVPGVAHLWAAATWDVSGGSWGWGIALSTIGVLALPVFAAVARLSAPRCTRCRWPAKRHHRS